MVVHERSHVFYFVFCGLLLKCQIKSLHSMYDAMKIRIGYFVMPFTMKQNALGPK